VRLLLALQSLLIIMAGTALLTGGGMYGAEKFSDWNGEELGFAAAISCGLGAALSILGLLGLLTSCSKSYSWSYCFSIILLIVIILQCLAGILVFFFWNQIERLIVHSLLQSLQSYTLPSTEDTLYLVGVRHAWDGVQQSLACCGVSSADDWSATEFGTVGYVPESCCTDPSPGCGSEVGDGEQGALHQAGCLDALQREVSDNIEIALGVTAGVVAVQVLGMCLACCLARSVQVEHCEI